MPRHPVLDDLQEQSTWRLIGFSLITYGVYTGYYCRRQIRILNAHLASENNVPVALGSLLVILNWLSLALLIAYLYVEPGHPIDTAGSIVALCARILILFWAYVMRTRINFLTRACPEDDSWHNLFWSLIFAPFYFNYKINRFSQFAVGSYDDDEFTEELE